MAASPATATINILNVETFTQFLRKSSEGANYAHLLVRMAMRENPASPMFRRDSSRGGLKGDTHLPELPDDSLDKTATRLEATRTVCCLGREELGDVLHPLEALVVDPWKTAD